MDLLYGADVTLTMDNIQAVLKFGVLYKVSNMVACGLAWVNGKLSMTNLFSFCRIGLFIKSVDCTEDKVLTHCKNFILNHSSSDLLEISKSWPEDENVVSFLFDKDLLEGGVVKGTFGTFCLSSQIFGKCQTFCGAKSAKSAKLLKKSIDFMYNRQPGPSHPHLGMV